MSGFKRKGGDEGSSSKAAKGGSSLSSAGRKALDEEGDDDLAFEDPYEDEFEEEEVEDDGEEDEDEDEMDEDGKEGKSRSEDDGEAQKQVWRPGIDKLEDGETLEYDPSAYTMYHQIGVDWPCLSFDILRDTLGDARTRFPHSMFLVSGSQADKADNNKVTLMSLRELHKTYQADEDNEDEDDNDDDLDDDPVLEHINIPHRGGVNRIRSCPQHPGLVATMADDGKAHIFDAVAVVQGLMNPGTPAGAIPKKPAYTFHKHMQEGYALDWSPKEAGRLATGDCGGLIHVWNMGANSATWSVDTAPFAGHRGSVEDIQWSPSEATVFISSSTDRAFKVWDTRSKAPMITVEAHSDDINVISWSRAQTYLLATGCDDGSFKVWDLRAAREGKALANFTYHKGPITSVDWAPHDESVLCVSSADNQVTVWDLSVEADEEPAAGAGAADLSAYPPQLLFIHQGQQNVKEIHHHPHIPGVIVSTAEDGFNVFKPAITVSN